MKNRFTVEAEHALDLAVRAAVYHRQGYAGTEHILVGLLKAVQGTASRLLTDAGVSYEKLNRLIDRLIAPQGGTALAESPEFSPRAEELLNEAAKVAEETGDISKAGVYEIGTEHLLLAMLKDMECVGTRLLHTMGVDIRKLFLDTLSAMNAQGKLKEKDMISLRPMQNQSGSATPALDQYSRDMTKTAAEGGLDPVIGRSREIMRVMQILSRRTKNNPCLIGEPGVGKTAIVEGLAMRIAAGDVPPMLEGMRLVVLDLSGMVAGSKYRGEFEERIKNVIKEVRQSRNILLFIDELHTLIGAGGAEGALDASNILKPSLSRGEIQVIGATTLEEYRKYIEKDAALERRFQPVTVEEPNDAEALSILEGLRPCYEKHHRVVITDEALKSAVALSGRYINDRRLPDKAIDLIDEASSKVRIGHFGKGTGGAADSDLKRLMDLKEEAVLSGDLAAARQLQSQEDELRKSLKAEGKEKDDGKEKQLCVTEETIAEVVSEWTKIPVARLAEAETKRLARLEKELHKRVVGQDEAVSAVAGAIRRGRVGLKDPNRPTGSFLFLGPTGVGKTELSKAVAASVFESEQSMIRVDMSEYMEKYSVSKLIGSPPGYVGYDEGGQFSERVRRHPYSVILFDEIEKAHPDVFNILLQVLDEGHITDAHGRRVDFKNTCIIMTSNAGAQSIVDPKHLGFSARDDAEKDYETMKSGVMEEVKRIFRPEFLNRIDEIIVFHPLNMKEVEEITALETGKLIKRAKEQMNITLRIPEKTKKYLAGKGYSPKFGARPLRRVIQTEIENPLAEMILRRDVKEGDTVTVRCTGEKLAVTRLGKRS